jgi:hypothetical protein
MAAVTESPIDKIVAALLSSWSLALEIELMLVVSVLRTPPIAVADAEEADVSA